MNPAANRPEPAPPPTTAAEDETTGLPLLRTWRAVYGFVAVVFAAGVALLVLLSRIFS
jgi:hypothetical protein